ncbi:MAG: hypothetical protein WCF90_07565 [Methanomicrobiales archaeon]
MRLAYVGLSLAMALYIIAHGVNKPIFFYASIIPVIVFIYGIMTADLPETPKTDEEKTGSEINDPLSFFK